MAKKSLALEIAEEYRRNRLNTALTGLMAGMILLAALLITMPAFSAEKTDVRVRFGDHAKYSRMVFDWPSRVKVQFQRDGDRLVLSFDTSANFDTSRFRRIRPARITGLKPGADGRTITIDMKKGSGFKQFRIGPKLVLDITDDPVQGRARSETKPANKSSGRVADIKVKQSAGPVAKKGSPPKKKQIAKNTKPVAETAVKPGRTAPVPLARGAKPGKAVVQTTGTGPGEGLQEAENTIPEGAVPVLFELRNGRVILRFQWPENVGLAALHRGASVWLAFDGDRPFDLSRMPVGGHGPLLRIDEEPSTDGKVVRLSVLNGAALAVLSHDTEWIIDIGGGRGRAIDAVPIETQADAAGGPRVFLPVAMPGKPMIVADPDIGDRFGLIPLKAPGFGIRNSRRYVLFDIHATPQGIAVGLKGDDVRIGTNDIGVTVHGDGTLFLADEAKDRDTGQDKLPTLETMEQAQAAGKAAKVLLKFTDWLGKGHPSDTKARLLQRIASAAPVVRNQERLALARFFVARGLSHEALGVLKRIEDFDRRADVDPAYRGLRGVAHLIAADIGEADADLGHPRLTGYADIALFRGLMSADRREFEEAHRQFKLGIPVLKKLPLAFRPRMRLAIAETALAMRDFELASEQVERLLEQAGSAARAEQAKLIRARIAAHNGIYDTALPIFTELADSIHRPVRAEALFQQAELLLGQDEISTEEAISRMEKLRFSWRGDVFEFDLLKRLGELYVDVGEYRKALTTMRLTGERFPDLPEAQALDGEMRDVFEEVFLGPASERMSPITAMGLYYDFHHLTPDGDRGDKMIQRLADRLAAVELLDEAAKMLKHQVRQRLKGPEKARVGARVAVLYLLDGRPEDALEALNYSRQKRLPYDLRRERVLLRARAHTKLGRYDMALKILGGLTGMDVNEVRTEVLWRARKWNEAANSLGSRLLDYRPEGRPLSRQVRNDILRFAIASSLAGNYQALEKLQADFGERLKGQPEYPAFLVVTSEDQRDTAEFRNLAAEIAQVDRFENFMSAYRDKLKDEVLSAIN